MTEYDVHQDVNEPRWIWFREVEGQTFGSRADSFGAGTDSLFVRKFGAKWALVHIALHPGNRRNRSPRKQHFPTMLRAVRAALAVAKGGAR